MAGIDLVRRRLGEGLVIPACPLALNARRNLDERRQRALFRYYIAAGAGGLAVGVHTTQFAIHDPKVGLFRPVLGLAAEELRLNPRRLDATTLKIAIGGICGATRQAVAEAGLLQELGFHAGLLSLGALKDSSDADLLIHCRTVSEIIPLIGFYLQPAAGGRVLSYSFWRGIAEIDNIVAVKIAPFNRYQTLDVVRAIAESGRNDIALYTGNDDNIVIDLVTPFRFTVRRGSAPSPSGEGRGDGVSVERHIVGGLLGHWAVWTKKATELHAKCRRISQTGEALTPEMLRRNVEITDANAAFFDAVNGYAGCIPGIHEVLRRQGLLEGIWCLDPKEILSPGQREEIDRVYKSYPHLNDDAFVAENRDEWLRG